MPATEPSQASPSLDESYFPSTDGVQLYLASMAPPSPKARVLVLHGYADHALRYRHVLEALAQAGYAAHALDYRGHGRASGRRGYVRTFDDYLNDVKVALARVEASPPEGPLFLLAHSNGALVAATLLEREPKAVQGAVLTGPYFRLRIVPSAFQLFQAKVVGRLIPALSVKNPVTSAMLTHDEQMREATDLDPLRHDVVTPRWFSESNAAQRALFENAAKLTTPLLMLQGGDDPVADPSGAQDFLDVCGSPDKHLTVYPGMFHEVLNEVERDKPIAEAIAWLDQHLGHRA